VTAAEELTVFGVYTVDAWRVVSVLLNRLASVRLSVGCLSRRCYPCCQLSWRVHTHTHTHAAPVVDRLLPRNTATLQLAAERRRLLSQHHSTYVYMYTGFPHD